MNTASPDKVRTSMAMRVAGLFTLVILAIAFFASPMVSLAANNLPACAGPDDLANDELPVATLVAAYTIKAGTKPTDPPTMTLDRKFKASALLPPATGIELVQVKLSNNKIVFGVFRGQGVVMTFQGTKVEFVKIKQLSAASPRPI